MSITNFLVGKSGLAKQRDRAIDFAKERYDPNVFQPQVDLFSERADEGLDERLEDTARQRTVESLFRPRDRSIYGSQTSRAIAGSQQESSRQQQSLGEFERSLTEADIQAQQSGERGLAEARTKQEQMESQQQAAIQEAELQYETELDRRKKQLASKVGQMAGTVAGVAGAGPLASALIGGAGGFIGSGGQASGGFTGAYTGALTAYQVGQDEQETPEQPTPEGSLLNANETTAGIGAKGMDSELPENMSGNVGQPRGLGDNTVYENQEQSTGGTSQGQTQQPFIQPERGVDKLFPADIDPTLQGENGGLSFDQFLREQSMSDVSNAPIFGGYGNEGQGERAGDTFKDTASFFYDRLLGDESITTNINPIIAIQNLLRKRNEQAYQEYQNQ